MQVNLYVDSVISGCNTEQEAIHYCTEARTIMSNAKFNLRNWACNTTELKAIATKDGTSDDSSSVTQGNCFQRWYF